MEATHGLSPEDIFRIRLIGAPELSPDGGRLLLTETWCDPEDNKQKTRLLIREMGDDSAPRAFTQGPNDGSARWSPNGREIAFLRRTDSGRQLFVIPADGGEAIKITNLRYGVSQFAWSPDGKRFVLQAQILHGEALEGPKPPADKLPPEERYNDDVRRVTRLFHKLDGSGWFDETRTAVLLLEREPNSIRVLAAGDYDNEGPSFSPDGTLIAFSANRSADPDRTHVSDIHVVGCADGQMRCLTHGELSCSTPQFSRSGDEIFFYASEPGDAGYGHTRLYSTDLAGRVRCLSHLMDRSMGDQSGSDLPAPGGTGLVEGVDGAIYTLISDSGLVSVYRRDPMGAWGVHVGGERDIYSFAHQEAAGFVIAWADPVTPSAVSQVRGGEERLLAKGEVPEEIQAEFARPQHFTVRAPEGPPVDCWLLQPPGEGRVPLVTEVHGGPMSMYGIRAFFEFQLLVQQGYAVLFSNPRGSQGYSESFCNAIIGDWGNKDWADVQAAIDGALERFPRLDPMRLGIAGGSYGGFIVNWALGHTDRFRAAITMRSVVNRMSAMGTSDMGFMRVPQYGTRWWEDPRPYLQQSPLTYASNITTPLLIEHQEGDLRLPIEQGEQLFTVLKFLGRTVEMLRYPGEFHGMSRTGKPWHRVHRYHAILDWFARYI